MNSTALGLLEQRHVPGFTGADSVVKQKTAAIENRWDILYRDFSEVYDEFARPLHSILQKLLRQEQ